MPLQQVTKTKDQGRVTVIIRDAKGKTKSGVVRLASPRPAAPVLSAPAGSITGGTLNAGTYWYRVSATVGGIEGLACVEQSGVVASGSTGSVALTWAAVSGATAYKIYGRTQGAELLLASQAGTTFTDDNSLTPSGALPTMAKATATVDTNASNYAPQGGLTAVPQATSMKGAGPKYYLRYGSPAGYPAPQRT